MRAARKRAAAAAAVRYRRGLAFQTVAAEPDRDDKKSPRTKEWCRRLERFHPQSHPVLPKEARHKGLVQHQKMQELELAMTLLLFPLSDSVDSSSIKLPKSLQNLYSITLRAKIANLVNEKLLKFIHPKIQFEIHNNNSKFPDLLNSDKKIITQNFTVYNNNLINGSNGTKINYISSNQPISDKMASSDTTATSNSVWLNHQDTNHGTNTSATTFKNLENKNYWNQASELLTASAASNTKTKNLQFNNYSSSEFPYEPRLTQILKLWSWCENQLHRNQIGVPRMKN